MEPLQAGRQRFRKMLVRHLWRLRSRQPDEAGGLCPVVGPRIEVRLDGSLEPGQRFGPAARFAAHQVRDSPGPGDERHVVDRPTRSQRDRPHRPALFQVFHAPGEHRLQHLDSVRTGDQEPAAGREVEQGGALPECRQLGRRVAVAHWHRPARGDGEDGAVRGV